MNTACLAISVMVFISIISKILRQDQCTMIHDVVVDEVGATLTPSTFAKNIIDSYQL